MENLLTQILKEKEIENSKIVDTTISKLMENEKVYELSKSIKEIKQQILDIFYMNIHKEEFREAHIYIPNANAKKEYNYTFDMSSFPSIKIRDIKNLELVGLQFDEEKNTIFGTPTIANTIEIQIEFYSTQDENLTLDIKQIPFIVNADPKDLWLNKPSAKDIRFSKDDDTSFSSLFLDKKIVVASKRGRSHAHEGTTRDDDFMVKELPENWSIIAVADGAGSAKFARAGSKFATENIVNAFENEELLKTLSEQIINYYSVQPIINQSNNSEIDLNQVTDESSIIETSTPETVEESKLKIKGLIINSLYTQVKKLHTDLETFAIDNEFTSKDLHTTLIFTLIKKFDFGYVILSFGVGDCPINVLEENDTKVKLLNFLDVGEFGGGTRFITMPEIFSRPDMVNRFGINCFQDFSKLFLMTDGIYDPKFVVESKLENMETWKNFLLDLSGENEDKAIVDFINDSEIENQLSRWMDFWSKGNHDDRTLAIIY